MGSLFMDRLGPLWLAKSLKLLLETKESFCGVLSTYCAEVVHLALLCWPLFCSDNNDALPL